MFLEKAVQGVKNGGFLNYINKLMGTSPTVLEMSADVLVFFCLFVYFSGVLATLNYLGLIPYAKNQLFCKDLI